MDLFADEATLRRRNRRTVRLDGEEIGAAAYWHEVFDMLRARGVGDTLLGQIIVGSKETEDAIELSSRPRLGPPPRAAYL